MCSNTSHTAVPGCYCKFCNQHAALEIFRPSAFSIFAIFSVFIYFSSPTGSVSVYIQCVQPCDSPSFVLPIRRSRWTNNWLQWSPIQVQPSRSLRGKLSPKSVQKSPCFCPAWVLYSSLMSITSSIGINIDDHERLLLYWCLYPVVLVIISVYSRLLTQMLLKK